LAGLGIAKHEPVVGNSMSGSRSSALHVLRSMSLIGGATVGSIIIGLIRMKVFALLIGPSGIGLLGLLAAVQATAAALAGMGTASSGVRYLTTSMADPDPEVERKARWSFWALTLLLAVIGGLSVWLFRIPIALLGTGSVADAPAIGGLSLAVAFSVIAGAQLAILQAHRQIGDLARVQVIGALLGTIGGVAIISTVGASGIVPALVMVPLGTMCVALLMGKNVPPVQGIRPRPATLSASWRMLLSLGAVMMVSGFVGMATQIAVRSRVVQNLGLEAAGLYQAGWTISVTNIGLVLTAMAADYFPRLSSVAGDPDAERALVNQQLHIALLIFAPLLIGLTALAPLVLHVLYSSRFEDAAEFLRWQLLGDIFKLGGWTLGYVMIARNDKFTFLAVEIGFAVIFLGMVWMLTSQLGLVGAGVGYAIAYLCYFITSVITCGIKYDVSLIKSNLFEVMLISVICITLIIISRYSEISVLVLGVIIAFLFSIICLHKIANIASGNQKYSLLAQRLLRWIKIRSPRLR
jgi:O-antigen/teichoic acid export membrane protein